MPKPAPSQPYENNPLFIATKGLELLFKNGISIAILLLAFIGFSYLSGIPAAFIPPSDEATTTSGNADFPALTAEAWMMIGIMLLVVVLVSIFIGIIIRGVTDYAAARLARGKEVNLGEALGAVFSNFFGYAWVLIIVTIKTFLWSLLLLIPGFIMAVRYSLAGVSYFDKKLGGNAAVKDSLALTKGAWLTTYAAQVLLPLLTLGALQGLTTPGTNAILYRQYQTVGAASKPPAHLVSWLTLILPIAFLILLIGLVVLIAALFWMSSPPATLPPATPHGYV